MKKEYTYYFHCNNCDYDFESENKEHYCSKCGSEDIKLIDTEETELC